MKTTRENMSMNAEIEFKEISMNILYCTVNRIIGIISWLLIVASNICLLLCYCMLTASKYLEYMMIDICYDMDIIYFQKVANDTIQSVLDTVNNWTGSRDFVSNTNIKSEFASMLERHLAPDWANEDILEEHNINTDEAYVEIKKEPIVLNEDSSDESSYNSSDGSENESLHESSNDSSDEELTNINNNYEDKSDSGEIEDITEQVLAKREENKIVIDLVSDFVSDGEAESYMTI